MQSKAATVAAYMKEIPAEKSAELKLVRQLVKSAVPDMTEEMMYGMPAFLRNGKCICAMNAQKNYFSLYVSCESDPLVRHKKSLGKLNCGKCCIRFKKFADLPAEVIRTILREAMEEQGFALA